MRTILLVVVLAFGAAQAETPRGKGAAAPPADKATPADKAPAVKPVKQATRAELEAEVEQLRAENAKLKAENDQLKAKEADRQKRLEKATGTPATTLK